MTYEEFKDRLNQNLKDLMEKCDNGEVSLMEVVKYGDYIQKLLYQFRQTEGLKEKS